MAEGYDEPIREDVQLIIDGDAVETYVRSPREGIRSLLLGSYEWPKWLYAIGQLKKGTGQHCRSATHCLSELGAMVWYSTSVHKGNGIKKDHMDVDGLIQQWKTAIVGLAIAHDKDEADRYEASIEACLTPILTAPVKEIRQFASGLLLALRSDKSVPYLVWRGFEGWIGKIDEAKDDDVKELKIELARQIVDLVESDAKEQLADAMIRALMWRSPEKLEEVKKVVEKEKAAGRKTRLKGRESCLFLEAGGTEDEPAVCIQV